MVNIYKDRNMSLKNVGSLSMGKGLNDLFMAVDRFIEHADGGGEFLDRKMIKIKRLLSEIKDEYKELRGTDFNSEMNLELLRFVKDLN